MKTIINILVIIILSVLISLGQDKNGYIIKGRINGLPNATKLYLIRTTAMRTADTVQITTSLNNQFLFKGEMAAEGEIHYIKIDSLVANRSSYISLVLDNSVIEVAGDLSKWPAVSVVSDPTNEYINFFKIYNPIAKEYDSLFRLKGGDATNLRLDREKHESFLYSYFESHPDSYTTPLLISKAPISTPNKENVFNKLTAKIKTSYYGVELLKQIKQEYIRSNIDIGKKIPEFTIETQNGKLIPIGNLINLSKYTLIDFWASWCVPCREEIPNLKKAYDKYHPKGFNIISVAVKDNKQSWLKALKEDNTPWINVMEQKRDVWNLFGFQSIPAYALVDNKGTIISFQWNSLSAKGDKIRGENLNKKLAELFRN